MEAKNAVKRPGGPGGMTGMLSLDDLRDEAKAGTIDTVVAAFTDMQGRLFGKRIQVEFFLDDVTEHGIEGCNYLLALDMEMEPVPGYEMANAEMGYTPLMASELEFYLYKESYAEAHEKDYRDLTPTIPYILDYHILATTMDEAYLGPIRRGMHAAGIPVEFSKGDAWYGQHEVNFRYADAVTSADRHTIYKNGVKEIAFLNEISASFMAKPSEKDIGSSCHIHQSLVDSDGKSAFVDENGEETDTFRHFLGGMRDHVKELALFIAPSVNSYKRYASESWAPTSVSWGRANRTCGFRIVGHGQSHRIECRIPGADANPYLAFAALLAAGLDGIEKGTDPGTELKGNAYEAAEAEPFPSSLREAKELWDSSDFVKSAFGEAVQNHYSNYARSEQQEFDQVVTDYERRRMFERG